MKVTQPFFLAGIVKTRNARAGIHTSCLPAPKVLWSELPCEDTDHKETLQY